jgi:hypothetical protein
MMRIILILKNILFYREPLGSPPLGRWQIEKCNAKLNYKIDLSNRDHSGNCDEYIIKHHIKYRDIKNNSNKSSLKI